MSYDVRRTVRFDRETDRAMVKAAEAENEDLSDYIRRAVRARLKNVSAPSSDAMLMWCDMSRDLGGAASNLNQLAREAHLAKRAQGAWLDGDELSAIAHELQTLGRRIVAIIEAWV